MSNGVTPTLSELVELRAQVARLRRRPPGGDAGTSPSAVRGRGMEYAESREYAQGDDARHVDWRLTARTGRAHTKVFHAERDRLTVLLVDAAPALFYGTRVRFKSVQAARLGAAVAWAAVADGERIAALTTRRGELPVTPMAGERGALRVLDALCRWCASGADVLPLEQAIEQARRVLRPGSRLALVGDARRMLDVPDARWPALVRRHETSVVLLADPLETEPPQVDLPVEVAAGPVRLDLRQRRVRSAWETALAGAIDEAGARLRRHGMRVLVLSTPEDAALRWMQR